MANLENKIAVITGGVQPVTLALAKQLTAEGVKAVAVLVAQEAQLQELEGERVHGFVCNIGDFDDVTRCFDAIKEQLGAVDILINNPNARCEKTLLETTPEEWNAVLAINTHSLFYCCKQVFADMKERRTGKVINITSPALFGMKGDAAFAVSKATVLGFNGAISRETERYTTTCHAVTPAGNATAQEVAEAVCVLLSESGRFAHGQNITVTHSFLEM